MKDQLLNLYKKTKIKHKDPAKKGNKIFVNFTRNAKIDIIGPEKQNYYIKFIDKKTNSTIYDANITNNMWSGTGADYFVDWKIEILAEGAAEPIVIDYNAKGKKVRIINQSPSLGDCVAWTPIVSEFQKKHECVVDYFTPYLDLFKDQYKNINFLPYPDHENGEYYATYDLGYYFNEGVQKTPIDARKRNLQQTACDILGLPYKEIKPSLFLENKTRPLSEKYICITTSSTAGCKHWQNEKGWQKVVDYVNNLGYKVVVIQKEALDYMDLRGLKNVIHPTTESLQEAMSWINYCEFYIGLGSGISWLAWGLGKKVILISGFSKPFAEFNTPHRIINTNVCNGCWNDTSVRFDVGDWNWCPRGKNFICSKEITFEMVKPHIDFCVKGTTQQKRLLKI
jgi:autotransporter strand-loop-strand O-heptosyltransferase